LAAIGQFDLLNHLYQKIYIVEAVLHELNAEGRVWPGYIETTQAPWIERRSVQNQAMVRALTNDLDQGEAESIVLAVELKADLILLDEKEGRRMAGRLGLHVTGVAGILLEAKTKDLIDSVRPHLDRLRYDAGFYLSDATYQAVIDLAGETP
jgi:predicted nucleic acid-binding protein